MSLSSDAIVHSYVHAERIWQSSSVIIINSQKGNGVGRTMNWVGGWLHTWKRCPENFKILKNLSWGSTVEARGWVFSDLMRSDQLGSRLVAIRWDLRHHKMHCVGRDGCQRSMVSIGTYKLCLSPRVAKGWRPKEINPFVSETTESVCIIIDIMAIQQLEVA